MFFERERLIIGFRCLFCGAHAISQGPASGPSFQHAGWSYTGRAMALHALLSSAKAQLTITHVSRLNARVFFWSSQSGTR